MTEMKAPAEGRVADTHSDQDLVGQYLNEIGSTPLLTADDEVALAKRIEAGVYAAELLRRADAGEREVSDEDRRDLAMVARDGRRAKEYMIRANLRLVVSVAKKQLRGGVPFADVIQEGNAGLIHAVEKFDYTKGYKFSTYATWWIRQSINRGLAEQGRTVRLPVHVVEQLNKFDRLERKLGVRLEREPTTEELAAEAGVSVDKLTELRRSARDVVSFDVPVGEDGETSIGDLVEDMDAPRATDIVEQQAFTEEMRTVLDSLPEREATIITLRYGLHDGHQHTLQNVAARLGLTRERIRQLEKQALANLRRPERSRPLTAWAS
ncbi:RNA polymerase primary sigma factor/RNA polymerase nonessential primary-like sigma factor [Halopolyspora algeriensis]|uniref:RNA polymerase sigma factor n=1 Tax=Halopolyspora algeriensis TaxID=1500506 RepID=A0A368VZL8_9ACTN|nr:sigma-70 family RNA polymerase sigma factor [Halopolyspora algeriensis]RCW46292.1 RNA polymerase primary sigma factor/RNA polymerase nonessential primary-like sigma factor [Halopolyspora algeriensis]TQM55692.1 RNA polymerase primary sigma factor/RNA polymerase nonessential primary-like sigma factor [Halopolyspora algeriensis]